MILTFDTHQGPTREGGLPPRAWPRPAGWRRPLDSGPASVGWWWRWWSLSSTGCPRAGGRPAPPLIPHLEKRVQNLSCSSKSNQIYSLGCSDVNGVQLKKKERKISSAIWGSWRAKTGGCRFISNTDFITDGRVCGFFLLFPFFPKLFGLGFRFLLIDRKETLCFTRLDRHLLMQRLLRGCTPLYIFIYISIFCTSQFYIKVPPLPRPRSAHGSDWQAGGGGASRGRQSLEREKWKEHILQLPSCTALIYDQHRPI